MNSLAEDFLLLLLDDAKGTPLIDGTYLDYGLAGAVLIDLALSGRIVLGDGTGPVKAGRVEILPGDAPNDPVQAACLDMIAAGKAAKPDAVVNKLATRIRPQVLRPLVEAGILHPTNAPVLGVFPRTVWPASSVEREESVRASLRAVVLDGREPDEQDSALLALLLATDSLTKAIPDARGREVKARAKAAAGRSWAAGGVRRMIEAVEAAMFVAVMMPIIATSGS